MKVDDCNNFWFGSDFNPVSTRRQVREIGRKTINQIIGRPHRGGTKLPVNIFYRAFAPNGA
jgi:hypothetical protein